MPPWMMLLPGVLAGAGLALVVAALVPAAPSLGAALERLSGRGIASEVGGPTAATLNEQIGARAIRQLSGLPGFRLPLVDLKLIGLSTNRYMTQKVLMAGVFLIAPLAIGFVFQALGLSAFYIPALFGLPLAIAGWFVPNLIVRGQAAEARAEFSRAVAVYLELVASERNRGASPSRALESAARVGRSWVFVRLSQELAQARYAGIAAWDALERLSIEIDVPDLTELARRMRLSGEEGASVYETLRAQGKSLRNRLLNERQEQANKSTTAMVIPMAATGFIFLLLIGTPFVLDAFLSS
ncbi:type II secretion system F family protein [Microbacterium paludicola]|uniref:TadC protein n=1 Tax=Microbacterium paludicola TaxID=300019 RepID=A0A4Y9FWK4_9MICO|nr:type II secretion system F family protein [Microbacterium paludicola]MBF0816663.1 type II secretion system F family protein [Microbacterium paludicola]TFU32643.1 TadC protein [Microbacterium paludicola]